jgi:hypothetical protein
MSYLIVVAHYKENLDWLKSFDPDKILVYNKNEKQTEYHTINLPNLGRESNTYLKYIVDNYDNLPEVVVFMQGKDDHLSTVNIKHFLNKMELFPARKVEGNLTIFDKSRLGLSKEHRIPRYGGKTLIPAEYDFNTWFTKYIRKELPNYFCVFWGACFLVRKEAIRSKPIQFYFELYQQTMVGEAIELGHFFERSWYYIFT